MKNNIKNALVIATMALTICTTRAQTAVEAWGFPGLQIVGTYEVTSGDILVLGRTLGSHTLQGVTADITFPATTYFIGKFDPVGNNWHWAKSHNFYVTSNPQLFMAEDASGEVLIGGILSGTLNYDGSVALVNSAGGQNTGLLKISGVTGNLTWAHQEMAAINSLDCDGSNAFIAGNKAGHAFLTKISSSGASLWSIAVTGNSQSQSNANAVAIDNSGNSYITGYYWGSPAIGSSKFVTTKNQTAAMFLAKYNSSGVFQWVKCVAVENQNLKGQNWYFTHITGDFLDIDNNGNVYIAGTYNAISGINFGNNVTLIYNNYGNPHNNTAPSHCYLVKYNSSGTAQFAREIVSKKANGFPLGGMFVSSNDNIFLLTRIGAGFEDSLEYVGQNLTAAYRNFAVSEFSGTGNYLTTVTANSSGTDGTFTNKMQSGSSNNILLSGYFRGTVYFGASTSLTAVGTGTFMVDGFIARYTDANFRRANGITEKGEQITKLTLFPNPVTDMLRITSSQKIGEVYILDATGKVCGTYSCPEKEAELNLEGLAGGVYFLKAKGSGETIKVIKQ